MMKKSLVLTLAVALIATIWMGGTAVQAQFQAPSMPTLAVHNLFAALNEGDVNSALDAFDTRASARTLPSGESYLAVMLEGWNREGRHFAFTNDAVTRIAPGLEMVTSDVEITDRGVTWGRQRILAVVYNGKIQRLQVVHTRLTPFQYWWSHDISL